MNDRFLRFVYRTRGVYMFLAFAISIVLKYYSQRATPLPYFMGGLFILILAQSFRTYSASYLWGRQAVGKPEADFLCTLGPYAHVRNPLYLGNFAIGIGLCLAINEWYAYGLFIASYAFVYSLIIPYEERFLQTKFGDLYLKYKAHTGRLLPRLKPYGDYSSLIPDYKAGLAGEIHVPIILAALSTTIYWLFAI